MIYKEGLQLELHESSVRHPLYRYQWVKPDPLSSKRYVCHAVWGLLGVPTLQWGFKNSDSQAGVTLAADPGLLTAFCGHQAGLLRQPGCVLRQLPEFCMLVLIPGA